MVHDACLSSTVSKCENLFAFSTDQISEALESSVINDGRSMLAMFLKVLYMVEGLVINVEVGLNAIMMIIRRQIYVCLGCPPLWQT